ncbi:MAG TPA: GtrA family protein [Bacteroidetes bacterium]|nr:GtrA family protein [Bacteroidota bacterium]
MKLSLSQLKKLFILKAKYATASATATAVDYILYFILLQFGLQKTLANFISYPFGVVFNFMLQKKYIFSMKRGLRKTFVLAMLVSAGGWAMNATIFSFFMKIPFLNEYHWFAKILVNAIIFFYNFYGKRYVFEKRFIETD